MEKRGMEMAVSTLIIITIAVILLVAVTYTLTGGFKRLSGASKPLLDTAEGVAVRESCNLACTANDAYTFCCKKYTIDKENDVKCSDSRLTVTCEAVKCDTVRCAP
ncbi:MAG TPA: hypothetical protein VJK03_03020 [Candidatus Nanoarchaeia archaeon]|nr:hypothetical protein [Candidatus Nanoarchaeia archaeon]